VEPLVFRCTAEPALNLQWFLTEAARSAIRTGGGSWKKASLLEAAWILHQIPGEYRIAGMPAGGQTLLVGTMARAAVALGRTREIEPLRRTTRGDLVRVGCRGTGMRVL
jgi:hypothetical protein